MALFDIAIRQAKATGKAYTLGDTDGLSLAVSPEASKSWHFRYSCDSNQKRLSLGAYSEISLKEACTRREVARERGINPRKQRNQDRRHASLAEDHSFQKVFEQWFEFRKKSLKEGRQSTRKQIQRIFPKDILPTLYMHYPVCHVIIEGPGRRNQQAVACDDVSTWAQVGVCLHLNHSSSIIAKHTLYRPKGRCA